MKAYCLNCKEEKEIKVAKLVVGKEIKYIGYCIKCSAYLCRVLLKDTNSHHISSSK